MKRMIPITLIALTLVLSGCSAVAQQTPAEMKEIAAARDTCVELGGEFEQWLDGLNNRRWYCDFGESEDHER